MSSAETDLSEMPVLAEGDALEAPVTTKTNEECDSAIQTFVEVTGTDEALAHFLLQDVDFDVERALKRYYDEDNENDAGNADNDEVQVIEQPEASASVVSEAAKSAKSEANDAGFPNELTLLSWNIDGIDQGNLKTRFKAALHIIAKANPEVIFLQEMVAELVPKLFDVMERMVRFPHTYRVCLKLFQYNIYVSDGEAEYFTVILVSRNIRIEKEEVVPFPNSRMGRTMQIIEGKWHNLRINLINTHLESMGDFSNERKAQFFDCMRKLGNYATDPNSLSVLAGDLNIRDHEVSGVPATVLDAWEAAGSSKKTEFTWDLVKNDNHAVANGFKPRKRFDRVYFSGPYQHLDFSLLGTQRIRSTLCFPSDHFAVCTRFFEPQTKG
ncbi:5'-tyrosyl-DNA phosphodiesterase [Aphelenchoides avenae]|nr:5'-tyrosyl-DNA phosphodiesterase [Aphelenchus avenae]